MVRYERAIVGDASPVITQLLKRFLEARRIQVACVSDGEALWKGIEDGSGVDLVISDAQLRFLSGLELLDRVSHMTGRRPAVVLTSRAPSRDEETRASLAGVLGYLTKPLRLPDLGRALAVGASPMREPLPARRVASRSVASVRILDSGEPIHTCEAWNVSETGALLATLPVVEPGGSLDLEIVVGGRSFSCKATLVRVQEPSWEVPAGVGVHFDAASPELVEAIRRLSAG